MHLPETTPDQTRIGVSVAIPEPWADELVAARLSFGDECATTVPPHITVVGPTAVDVARLPEVYAHLGAVAAATNPFRLHLRGSGTFRPTSPVVFINVVQGISECESLERAARSGPLAQEKRFNYHPHVTVAHEVPGEALDRAFRQMATFEAAFDVTEFWLYEHGPDAVWRPQRNFALGHSPT